MREAVVSLGKIGFEVELLAPRGKSRRDLAEALAENVGGSVERIFYPQGEPSKADHTPFFENLTLGFEVRDRRGDLLVKLVDDLTLQQDLDREAAPRPGWYRIVSDDRRLLRLIDQNTLASAPLERVLLPIAELFGSELERGPGGMLRLADEAGNPVAIGAPLPGERERPCEVITAPIEANHQERIESILSTARVLGFTIPAEGANHIHFDAAPLERSAATAKLIRLLDEWGPALRERYCTNPACVRLGPWDEGVVKLANDPAFARLPWEEARAQLMKQPLSKYCDFNISNYIRQLPQKRTFEVRILPVWLKAEKLVSAAADFSRILSWASDPQTDGGPLPSLESLL
ncbi:MAG: amidoligase family protein [Verrucomicrobiota bacterium]